MEIKRRDRRRSNPPRPVRIQLAHAGGGVWVALVVDRHGAGLELITGTEREVLLTVRGRWPALPIHRLPFAIETEGPNGHRVNPAGEPVRVEIAHAGGHRWLGLVLTERDEIVEAIWADSKAQLLALLRERWPRLPVMEVPFVSENPRGKAGGREAGQVTDRALRYRANTHPPPGPRVCALCGSTRNVEIGHVNGREEDGSPTNLIWTCRACNVR